MSIVNADKSGRFEYFITDNEGWYVDDDLNLRSPIGNPQTDEKYLTFDIYQDGDITVVANGWSPTLGTPSSYDPAIIYDKDNAVVFSLNSVRTASVTLTKDRSPFKICFKNTAGGYDSNPSSMGQVALITEIEEKMIFSFDGDFTSLQYDDYVEKIEPKILKDIDTTAVLVDGVGLTVTGDGSIYAPSQVFSAGEYFAVANQGRAIVYTGIASETGMVVLVQDKFIFTFKSNGEMLNQPIYTDDGVRSYLVISGSDVCTTTYKVEPSNYAEQIESGRVKKSQRLNVNTTGRRGFYAQSTVINTLDLGYYQSTVLINNTPIKGKKVFCFTNDGFLVDSTVSDENGVYRFDYLELSEKYMFVAQHSNVPDAPPEYNAVASDWQTPTKYGE